MTCSRADVSNQMRFWHHKQGTDLPHAPICCLNMRTSAKSHAARWDTFVLNWDFPCLGECIRFHHMLIAGIGIVGYSPPKVFVHEEGMHCNQPVSRTV